MSASVIAQLYAFAETPGMPPCDFESALTDADENLVPLPTDHIPSGVEEVALTSIDPAEAETIGEDAAPERPTPVEDIPAPGSDPDLWLYRRRTVALLRKYMRISIEVGRLPSLLGREFFRTRVTSYRASTFEDAVIFVHDVERSLEQLNEFDKKLIAKIVLQEYPQEEAARLIGCGRRHAVRCFPEALDRVTEMFLKKQLLTRLPSTKSKSKKSCQGGKSDEFLVSDSEQAKNNS
jgi:hypothetical protein